MGCRHYAAESKVKKGLHMYKLFLDYLKLIFYVLFVRKITTTYILMASTTGVLKDRKPLHIPIIHYSIILLKPSPSPLTTPPFPKFHLYSPQAHHRRIANLHRRCKAHYPAPSPPNPNSTTPAYFILDKTRILRQLQWAVINPSCFSLWNGMASVIVSLSVSVGVGVIVSVCVTSSARVSVSVSARVSVSVSASASAIARVRAIARVIVLQEDQGKYS